MKKGLLMLGAAAMMLASCTQNEVMEVAENRTIGFDAFVGNTTKGVTEVTNDGSNQTTRLQQYFVFGNFGTNENGSTWTGQVFNNELSTVEYYWQQGNYYRFGAYADGNNGKIESSGSDATVTYNAASQTLTFNNYIPSDTKDLVAALGTADASSQIPTNKVGLTFNHMLCQVGLTFKTEIGKEYTLSISDIQINNAINKATGTYAPSAIAWSGQPVTAAYKYDNITDLAGETTSQAQQFKLVIPQNVPTTNTKINVTFKAKISGGGFTDEERSFSAELTSPDENKWKPGYRYNYTATINGDNIIDQLTPIEFEVTSIQGWDNIDGGTINPTPTLP